MTQDEAYNLMKLGHNVFITGAAGTGKTHVIKRYADYIRSRHIEVAITAPSGIAATHMNGITIHSWSGIYLDREITGETWRRIRRIKGLEEDIRNTKVLIIDEVSMLHHYRLDMVDLICRRIRKIDRPFGGLQVIMSGDFFQLPPIQNPDEQDAGFVNESRVWKNMSLKICYLTKQYRQDDEQLLGILNEIRDGQIREKSRILLESRLNKPVDMDLNIKVTQLYTTNRSVDAINNYELNKIEGKEVQYVMQSRGLNDLIVKLKKGCMAPEDLRLKIDSVVMFVRNNYVKGYVNGTLGRVVRFDKMSGYPIIETINKKEVVAIPESWSIEKRETVIAEITQVPLRLAWAITIHKSQGMSLDVATIDLSEAFVEGMGYVALSRVRRLSGIKLLGINSMALKVYPGTILLDQDLQKTSEDVNKELKELTKWKLFRQQRKILKLMKKPSSS